MNEIKEISELSNINGGSKNAQAILMIGGAVALGVGAPIAGTIGAGAGVAWAVAGVGSIISGMGA